MSRHSIRSFDDLPERPNADDLMLQFRGFETLSSGQSLALQRAVGARYKVSEADVQWTEKDAGGPRFNTLLLALHRSGHHLECDDPVVTPVPPADTQHFATLEFHVIEAGLTRP